MDLFHSYMASGPLSHWARMVAKWNWSFPLNLVILSWIEPLAGYSVALQIGWSVPLQLDWMNSMTDCRVEVCFASPDAQQLVSCEVKSAASVREVVLNSSLPEAFPDYDFAMMPCGIFGQRVPDDHPVKNGDRIEIYRPLVVDPKARRRARAAR